MRWLSGQQDESYPGVEGQAWDLRAWNGGCWRAMAGVDEPNWWGPGLADKRTCLVHGTGKAGYKLVASNWLCTVKYVVRISNEEELNSEAVQIFLSFRFVTADARLKSWR